MKMTSSQLTVIMKKAWALARHGVSSFGGNVKEYFSMALKIAWMEFKAIPATAWSKQFGNRYLLPGLKLSIVHNNQLTLPGISLK